MIRQRSILLPINESWRTVNPEEVQLISLRDVPRCGFREELTNLGPGAIDRNLTENRIFGRGRYSPS